MRIRRSDSAKRHLPRLSIEATPYNYQSSLVSPSSSISSARASVATSYDTPSSAGIFYAVSLYDFEATDAEQLSFKKDEVLEIVKQEDSGWWAAIRDYDGTVGWIPSAFVEPISEETADRLRSRGEQVQIQENDAERAYLGDPNLQSNPYDLVSPGDGIRGFDWLPMSDGEKASLLPSVLDHTGNDLPKDVSTSAFSPLVANIDNIDPVFPEQELTISPSSAPASKYRPYPPSPTTPMPYPPKDSSSPLPPRPSPGRSQSSPLPQSSTLVSTPMKSRMDTATVLISRHLRRRPVLIDDSTSLSRLSTLFESSNVEEVDLLASSPVVAESIDAYSRLRANRNDAVKQGASEEPRRISHPVKVAECTTPLFLQPEYGEDELILDHEGNVIAGTLPALVERLTLEPLKCGQDSHFRQAFFMTFRTFATSDEVFDLLISQYHMEPPCGLTVVELEQWKEKRLLATQKRVLSIFITWLEHYRLVQDDPPIARRLQDFLSGITSPVENKITAKQVMSSLERMTFAVPPTPVTPSPSHKRRKTKSSKNDLLKMDPSLITEHLCLYESKLYSKVHPQHCLDYIKKPQGGKASELVAFCATHDRLASWVKSSILYTDNLSKRADCVEFWIKVAEKCRVMNNFSALSAIVTALSSTVVSRLHLTWAYVGRSSHLEALVKVNDPNGNFATCRILQQAVEGPCVPFVGMYLTDITHINDHYYDNTVITANSAKSSATVVNFVKRQKWYDVVSSMLRHQGKHHAFAEDPTTLGFLEANLVHAGELDQASFWTKSQEVQQAEMADADISEGLAKAGF